jgi:hypothetical protein
MVGSRAGSVPVSLGVVLSILRWTRFSSFILRFSIRFISFCLFWNVVVILSPRYRVHTGPRRVSINSCNVQATNAVRAAAGQIRGNLRLRSGRVLRHHLCHGHRRCHHLVRDQCSVHDQRSDHY